MLNLMTFAAIILTMVTTFAAGAVKFKPESYFKDGDFIFHKSQSAQSPALQEATGSPWTHVGLLFTEAGKWYVVEAVEPVKITAFEAFVNRGKNKEYRVYRHNLLDASNPSAEVAKIKAELQNYIGKSYDIFFEWEDDLIYCSELTFKAFYDGLGVSVGKLQKVGELKLDGPHVKKLIKDRLGRTGRQLNLEEPIVTPVSQIEDPNLRIIYRSH
jgi:hypothetical protein